MLNGNYSESRSAEENRIRRACLQHNRVLDIDPVLTALLAIDIVTATRWAGYAKRDWNDFRAARHADAQQQPAAP
jgi:hypothetical protein